jgi:hypothetical protein
MLFRRKSRTRRMMDWFSRIYATLRGFFRRI